MPKPPLRLSAQNEVCICQYTPSRQEIKSEKQISDAGVGYHAAQSSTETCERINMKMYIMLGVLALC